jgi:hypothetical protein
MNCGLRREALSFVAAPTKMPLHLFVVWIVDLALLAFLVAIMQRRKLLQEFPLFSAYTIFHLVYGIIELVLRFKANAITIFVFYWLREWLDVVLILSVMDEIFRKVLDPYPAVQRMGSRFYRCTMLLLIAVGVWMAASFHYLELKMMDQVLDNVVRTLHFVEVGLVFSLFIFCRIFGLNWRHYVFGLALGFGIKASLQTVGHSLWLQTGYPGTAISLFLMDFAYTSALVLWCYSFATEEKTVPVQLLARSPQLERWNTALEQLLAR